MIIPSGQDVTPDDYVSWQQAPPQSSGTKRSTGGRSKKRPRSTSPTSSPLKDGATRKSKESFDMKPFQGILKTPQTDMAADLWNKYIGKSKLDGALEIPAKFANLSSSPQTPASQQKSGRDSSALRRSVSCNVDWPSSKAKRRKVEGIESGRTAREIFSRSRSNVLDSGSSKKLSFLLNRIQDTLASAKASPKTMPPSSPPPIQDDVRDEPSPSPSKNKQYSKTAVRRHIPEVTMGGKNLGEQLRNSQKSKNLKTPSSEFGDDDFDDDLLALVDSSTPPLMDSVKEEKATSNTALNKQTLFKPQQSLHSAEQTNMKESPPSKYLPLEDDDDDDEFDDDVEFGEGMEELLTQYDGKVPVIQKKASVQTDYTQNFDGRYHGASKREAETYKQPENAASDDEFDDQDLDLEAMDENVLQQLEGPSQVGYP
jgi:DNA replication ATP-dependent helicase Dna2